MGRRYAVSAAIGDMCLSNPIYLQADTLRLAMRSSRRAIHIHSHIRFAKNAVPPGHLFFPAFMNNKISAFSPGYTFESIGSPSMDLLSQLSKSFCCFATNS
jgi:hypothetical protein